MTQPNWDTMSVVMGYLTKYITATNKKNGWHESDRTFGDGIALLHTEVSEAFEAYRDSGTIRPNYDYTKALHDEGGKLCAKPIGVDSEMADVLIRLLDECDRQEIDLVRAVREKMRYNALRGYRHGGKVI